MSDWTEPRITFPQVRRGYDPSAVRDYIDELERQLELATQPDLEVREEAERYLARAREEAERLVEEASSSVAAAAAAERDAQEQMGRAADEAARMLGEARKRASEIVDEARAIQEQADANRWSGIGERVERILTVADLERDDLIEQATGEADRVLSDANDAAAKVREHADRYDAEVRHRTDAIAAERIASADADQAKAVEVLAAARTRAATIEATAVANAEALLRDAESRATEHVGRLLDEARVDLAAVESSATEARAYLLNLRELTGRTLEAEAPQPLRDLAPSADHLMSIDLRDDEVDAPDAAVAGAPRSA
jgi:DivIVA domain-containing protein